MAATSTKGTKPSTPRVKAAKPAQAAKAAPSEPAAPWPARTRRAAFRRITFLVAPPHPTADGAGSITGMRAKVASINAAGEVTRVVTAETPLNGVHRQDPVRFEMPVDPEAVCLEIEAAGVCDQEGKQAAARALLTRIDLRQLERPGRLTCKRSAAILVLPEPASVELVAYGNFDPESGEHESLLADRPAPSAAAAKPAGPPKEVTYRKGDLVKTKYWGICKILDITAGPAEEDGSPRAIFSMRSETTGEVHASGVGDLLGHAT